MTIKNIPKKLCGDDEERAVSPVIGVILMVAITVILAAVIAAFVLDIGPTDTNPNAGYSIDEIDDDEIEVELNSLDGSADGITVLADSGDDEDIVEGPDSESNQVLTVTGQTAEFDLTDGSDPVLVAYSSGDDSPGGSADFDDYAIIDNLEDYK